MEKIEFRFFKDSDYSRLIEILKANGSFDKDTDSKRIFRQLTAQNPKTIILAVDGKKIVGHTFAIFTPFESYIHHLGVAPGLQGKGIGSKLLKFAEKTLKAKGAKRINLFCRKEMKGYYEARGWTFLKRVACFEKYP